MQNVEPLVSVGVPIRNEAPTLEAALTDILKQTHRNIEIIICDNASTDGTDEICRRFANSDPRIRYVRNENDIGALKNFWKTFDLSRGDYFFWASGHDLRSREFVKKCLSLLIEFPTVVISCPRIVCGGPPRLPYPFYWDTRGMGRIARFQVALWDWVCVPIYGLLRSEALRRVRRAESAIGGDNILVSELALLGEFAVINEDLLELGCMDLIKPYDYTISIRKVRGNAYRPVSRARLFLELLLKWMGAGQVSCQTLPGRVFVAMSVAAVMFFKFAPEFFSLNPPRKLKSVARSGNP